MANINQSFNVVQEVSQALMNMQNPSSNSTMYSKSEAAVYSCSVEKLRPKFLEYSQEKTVAEYFFTIVLKS